MKLSVIDIVEGTSVDGPGLRTSIYFAGCTHHCEGCHNQQSWDISVGKPTEIDDLMQVIKENDFNVTFSGGDPFFQCDGVAELAWRIHKELGKTVWCYTGYLWENVIAEPKFANLLRNIDILVDGRFVMAQRDTSLRFKGSANQRIIDVAESLKHGEVVLWKPIM